MLKLLRSLIILCLLISFLVVSGCSIIPSPLVVVGPGQYCAVLKSTKIPVLITNKETGKLEKRYVVAQPGWVVGRMPEGK